MKVKITFRALCPYKIDEDGNEINFVSTNTDDEFKKLMELLEINEDEYLE